MRSDLAMRDTAEIGDCNTVALHGFDKERLWSL